MFVFATYRELHFNRKFVKRLSRIFYKKRVAQHDLLGYNDKEYRLKSIVVETRSGVNFMKDLKLLVWLTQLGISVALPLGIFIGGALWLRNRFDLGSWILVVGIILGFGIAIHEFYQSMKLLDRVGNKKKKEESSAVFFNDHE